MNSKEMPFVYPPIVDSYSGDAGRVAVQQNYENHIPLIICNHLTLIYDKKLECCGFNWENYNNDGFVDIDIRDNINKKSFTDYIIKCIDDNYNVQIYLDHYYIENVDSYKKCHFVHDYASIIGYDLNAETFKVADNFNNGKYYIIEASFKNVEKARRVVKNMPAIKYILNHTLDYDFISNENIYLLLKGHLESKYLLQKKSYNDDTITYGLKIYDILLDYFEKLYLDQVRYDHRSLHTLYNHKKIYLLLLDYLNKNKLVDNYEDLIKNFKDIEIQCLVSRNLLIKYSINKDKNIIIKIIRNIIEIREKEVKCIKYLIDKLKW